MSLSLLVVGPRTCIKEPSKTGGAVVLFEQLIADLESAKVRYVAIDTNDLNYSSRLQAIIHVVASLLKYSRGAEHISLHSSRDFLLYFPIIWLISRFSGKTVSLRKFGGSRLLEMLGSSGIVERNLASWSIAKCDSLFVETEETFAQLSSTHAHCYLFPNVRTRPQFSRGERKFERRFVFVGSVKREKGVEVLLRAAEQLPSNYTIDVIGPLEDKGLEFRTSGGARVEYKGSLPSEEIARALCNYDVLVLPTFYPGEGHPGVLIEAYSVGLPVVATRWKGIPEIVEDGSCGILVDPQDVQGLVNALSHFTEENYSSFANAAITYFDRFDSRRHTEKFLETVMPRGVT